MVYDNIPDDWSVLRIKDLGRVVTGKTPPTSVSSHFGGDIPFITPSDMDGSKFIRQTGRYLTCFGVNSVKSSLIPADAIMVSCIGSDMGKVALTLQDSVTNQQINSIVPYDEFCPGFIYYSLLPRKSEFQNLAGGGSAQPILNKGHFSEIEIAVPPLPEQRAIAAVLGALDDKIELNRQMNQTLEAIAQAIFKSWFVDFDPVKAKAEGREPAGLAPEVAALFPDKLVDSELGLIPEGWKAEPLCHMCIVTMGQSPPGETYNEDGEGLPFYQGIRDFGFRFPDRRVFCSAPTRTAYKGQVLLSVRAPVGSLNVATEKCSIGRGLGALQSRESHYGFLYYFLKSNDQIWDKFNANGTVFGSIGKTDINNLVCLVPNQKLRETFSSLVNPMDDRVYLNEAESNTLAEIRHTLLPKLLSGEVRIKDAEKFVEAHL